MVEIILSDMQGVPYPDCEPVEISDTDFIQLSIQANESGNTLSGYFSSVLMMGIIDALSKKIKTKKKKKR